MISLGFFKIPPLTRTLWLYLITRASLLCATNAKTNQIISRLGHAQTRTHTHILRGWTNNNFFFHLFLTGACVNLVLWHSGTSRLFIFLFFFRLSFFFYSADTHLVGARTHTVLSHVMALMTSLCELVCGWNILI